MDGLRLFLLISLVLPPALSCRPDATGLQIQEDLAFAPGPLVILERSVIGGMSVGHSCPAFALYGDGTAVAERLIESGAEFVATNLTTSQVNDLILELNLTALEPFEGKSFTATTSSLAMHVTHTLFVRRRDRSFFRATVFGWTPEKVDGPHPVTPFPSVLDAALSVPAKYPFPSEASWTPPQYEIRVWECGYAAGTEPAWPAAWPDFGTLKPHADTRERRVLVEGAQGETVRSLLGRPNQRYGQRVRLKGKSWCSVYRPVFPDEALWRGDA